MKLTAKKLLLYMAQAFMIVGFAQPATAADKISERLTPLTVRANLLRWATLTPDLGLGWRINHKWTVLVNATYTSWSWNSKQRRYALWEVAPEVRRYLDFDNKHRAYAGVMYKAGSFNYKWSGTGRQGDIMGGGITGGYILPIADRLSLDFSLGLGYIHARYDRYEVIEHVRVKTGRRSGNWFGPVAAGISLVWQPF